MGVYIVHVDGECKEKAMHSVQLQCTSGYEDTEKATPTKLHTTCYFLTAA